MILPSLNFNSLESTGGINNGNAPNLYFYQSVGNNAPITISDGLASGIYTIDYSIDNGAIGFYNTIFGSTSELLGGSIQWINGNIN